MDKLKELIKNDKKKVIIVGCSVLVGIIVLIIVIVLLMNLFRRYDNKTVEKMMVQSTQNYLKTHEDVKPTASNPVVDIDASILIEEKYLKEFKDFAKSSACSGHVTIYYGENGLRYTPYLTCSSYDSYDIHDAILKQQSIVTTKNGLYELNNYDTYRGEFVDNYISYAGYTWRIIKFNDELVYLVLADTVNSKTGYVYDDRYNQEAGTDKGYNSYEDSRISLKLNDIYDGDFKDHHVYLQTMATCVHTRSESDTYTDGSIECYSTYDSPISLVAAYDYMNASIDPVCSSIVSKNCSNYNYLAKTTNKWWLLNGTNANTYKVYSATTSGEILAETANTKRFLRPVIAIPATASYKSGNGTSDSPYQINEY